MIQPVVVASRTVHSGRKFDFVSLSVQRSAPPLKTLEREIVRHPGAVVVVPVTDDRRVVLIRTFRIAVNQWMYECCAGTIERERLATPTPTQTFVEFGTPGAEDPAACAARELIEETGYRAASLTPLAPPLPPPPTPTHPAPSPLPPLLHRHTPGWFFTTPGMTDEQMFPFVAAGLTHVGQQLEEDESIGVELFDADEVVKMVFDGRIRDAKSMLAILMARQAGAL